MRKGTTNRATAETVVDIKLNLDGSGIADVSSGSGFFDHMLNLFVKNARVDMMLSCKGDTDVDFHHSAEDIGITMGITLNAMLGEKRGINRYGSCILPMDEALVLVAMDFSGRAHLSYDVPLRATKLSDEGEDIPAVVGDFDTELVEEFFEGLTRSAGLTLHVKKLDGKNTHHILEAVFKGFGRAMRQALALDTAFPDDVPSTKGSL